MKIFLLSLVLFAVTFLHAQADTTKTKLLIDSINRTLDRAYVKKDIAYMQKHYADDFFFFHATGLTDTKESWIAKGMSSKNLILSREHDSVTVELHNDIAIVKGTLTVRMKPEANKADYAIRYIRVYALRKKAWQLISHNSTAQWNVK